MMLSTSKQYSFVHMTSLTEGLSSLKSDSSQCFWVVIKAGKITSQGKGNLQQASAACGKLPCVISVPANLLVITKLSLPTQRNSQRRTAIPFAVQNQLACNAHNLHWSWQSQGQHLQLVGIDKSSLSNIQRICQEASIKPQWIIADALHLAGSESLWKLIITPNYWMLNYGIHLAYRVEITSKNSVDDAMVWLQKTYDETKDTSLDLPLSIDIMGVIPSQLKQWFTTCNIAYHSISTHQPMTNSAALQASHFSVKTCINLLPKSHQPSWIPKINWSLWRLPYALVMVLGLVGLAHLWLTNQNLTTQLEQSTQQGIALFRQALPNERLIDPLTQLESLLLQAQKPKKQALFLPLLYEFHQQNGQAGEAVGTASTKASSTSKFKRLSFLDGKIKVDLATTEGVK